MASKPRARGKRPSPAQRAQREHRHRLGSILLCRNLLQWHLDTDDGMPTDVSRFIEQAIESLSSAAHTEIYNTDFGGGR